MQVIGLCRFSYPAIGGFQVEHDTIEERIRYLYAHARLEERFRLFETVSLPCLREQTDQDFDLIVMIGESLPKQHVTRLRDLIANLPQARVVIEPPRPQREVMKEALQNARRDPSKPCLQFRHDDDDAVSVDFIERLRAAADGCPGLLEQHRAVAFDFNRGYIAEMGKDGIAAAELFRPYYVAAMGMYVAGGAKQTIMNFAHNKINQFIPTVTFTDCPMFVLSHNGFNDSRQKKVKPVAVTPLTSEEQGEFAARFAINAAHVKQTFAAP